jgi:hypothetical protein
MSLALDLRNVAANLKDYYLSEKDTFVENIATIGFEAVPGSPVKSLYDYALIRDVDGKSERPLSSMSSADPSQPGGAGTFDPKTYSLMDTRSVITQQAKIDLRFTEVQINKLIDTYASRSRGGAYDKKKVPFEAEFFNQLALDIKKYLRIAFFKGVKASGTTTNHIFHGVLKQIADDLLLGTTLLTPITVTALTKNNIRAQFNTMKAALPEELRWSDQGVLLLSTAQYDFYVQAYQDEVGANPYNTTYDKMILEGSNLEIMVEPGLVTYNKPIVTTRNNLAMDVDFARLGTIDMEYVMTTRSINVVCDYFVGANFAKGSEIYLPTWA